MPFCRLLFLQKDEAATTGRIKGHAAKFLALLMLAAAWQPSAVFGAHPLITEDTGTQGKGNYQFELTAEFGHEKELGTEVDAWLWQAVLSYGLRDDLDVLVTLPYAREAVTENSEVTTERGISDTDLSFKWRFFEDDKLSVALKAGVVFPTGDETKGLGAGKTNYNVNLITSYETGPWGYHIHLGYIRNRNVLDERSVIHHASLALTREIKDKWKLVLDLGNVTSADRAFDDDAAFLTFGAIYSLRENFDIDLGFRYGLSESEVDYTLLAGIAVRF